MSRVKIVEFDHEFQYNLCERDETDMIVIHHTGSGDDMDAGAEQIHEWHLNQDWAGIGYHFVIRKNGTVERGRPEWAIGSHAYGENDHTLGIHLSGDFNDAEPTDEQIDACARLIADLCEEYDIPLDREHIVGHGELDAEVTTRGCPGDNLFAVLDDGTITGKAAWYMNHGEDANDGESGYEVDIEEIAVLARKYESNGDPGAVSNTSGDLGGASYGLYQFATNTGSVDEFVAWLCDYPDPAYANYGKVLAVHKAGSASFDSQWHELGAIDPGGFGKLQDEYIKEMYYDKAETLLREKHYHLVKHSIAMRAVVLSRAVQHGPAGCAELFETALEERVRMASDWNLSYVDDVHFDGQMIAAIYDTLIRECDCAAPDKKGVWRSPNGFCNGGKSVIYGLRSRFILEKAAALNMLREE